MWQLPNWISELLPKDLASPNLLVCPVSRRTGEIQNNGISDPACLVVDWDLERAPSPPSTELAATPAAVSVDVPAAASQEPKLTPMPEAKPDPEPLSDPVPSSQRNVTVAPSSAGPLERTLFGVDATWWAAGIALVSLLLCVRVIRRARRWMARSSSWVPLQGNPESMDVLADDRSREPLRQEMRLHMLGWLKEKFIRGLLFQRREMIQTQNHASARADDLVRRVAHIQKDLLHRIREAEYRVQELDKELARAKAENRELIKMNLALAQRELQEARKKAGLQDTGKTAFSSA